MAEGHGPSGHGVSGIEGGNVRIETLVSVDVAQSIWDMMERDFSRTTPDLLPRAPDWRSR